MRASAERPTLSAPLEGTRVVEVGGAMVGYAGRLLSDLGAEVIVLERPGRDGRAGDPRSLTPFATSPSGATASLGFEHHYHGKRSVAVDWTAAQARPLLERIAASADAVLVTSHPGRQVIGFSPGPALDWAPAAVVCSVTPYGTTGPQRHWRATAFTSFAGSGQMYPIGPHEGPPLAMPGRHPFDVAGTRACYLVQAALLSRHERSGGMAIDVSVHESVSWQRLVIEQFSLSGRIPDRQSYFSPPPGGVWECRDGRIDIAAHAPHHWRIFVDLLGRPDDLADPLYEDRAMRVQLFDLVAELISPHLAAVSAAEFVDRAQRAGLPCAMSFEPGQLANDLQMQARGYFRTVDSDEFGAVRLPGMPFRSEPELLAGGGPAPARGADTERLLAELGVPDGALDEWRRAGVI